MIEGGEGREKDRVERYREESEKEIVREEREENEGGGEEVGGVSHGSWRESIEGALIKRAGQSAFNLNRLVVSSNHFFYCAAPTQPPRISYQPSDRLLPGWQPIPYLVHYFEAGLWSKVVHQEGNRVPLGTQWCSDKSGYCHDRRKKRTKAQHLLIDNEKH